VAWVNVLDVPGITYAIYYNQSFGGIIPYAASSGSAPSPPATISGGLLVIPAGYDPITGNGAALAIFDTGGVLAATPEYPAIAMRATFDLSGCGYNGNSDINIDVGAKGTAEVRDLGFAVDPAAGPTLVVDAVFIGGTLAAGLICDASNSSSIDGATLLLEVDITLAPDVFWQSNVECHEVAGLVKDVDRTFDPGSEGQPFIPPYHNCTVDPPGPPVGDPPPIVGGGGGGGGDSGPPQDVVPVCEWQYIPPGGVGSSGGDHGVWVPTNAPCRGAPPTDPPGDS
jgi:hypothetical protein